MKKTIKNFRKTAYVLFCNKYLIGLVLCVSCFGSFGCIGGGGSIGYRKGFDKYRYPSNTGLYSGMSLSSALYDFQETGPKEDIDMDSVQPSYMVGLNYQMFFSNRDTLHILLPTLTIQTHPAYTMDAVSEYGMGWGGTLGMGLELSRRTSPGFHTALCGGVYGVAFGSLCGRLSSRNGGWAGIDVTLGAPPLFMFDESWEVVEAGMSGWAGP